MDIAQLVEHQTVTPLTQVRFPGAARDFSFRDSSSVRTPSDTCINTCAHVKAPVVHVRLRWIMETRKHPAYTVGWVAQLSQLALPRESNLNFRWERSHWDSTVVKM